MNNFQVGDKVRLKPGVYTSHEVFNNVLLVCKGELLLPKRWFYKEQYSILEIGPTGGRVRIDATTYGWWVLPEALESLTKGERWAISKNRVETRHIRKNCGQ